MNALTIRILSGLVAGLLLGALLPMLHLTWQDGLVSSAEALGGVAGHAGLFGTAADVARYLRNCWLAEDSPVLSRAVRAEALRCQTEGLDGRRGLGWTLRGDRWDHMSTVWPRTGAGHTGFTGTSVAFDPVSGLWAVLLTNAVHLGRGRSGIVPLRRQVHDALALGTL